MHVGRPRDHARSRTPCCSTILVNTDVEIASRAEAPADSHVQALRGDAREERAAAAGCVHPLIVAARRLLQPTSSPGASRRWSTRGRTRAGRRTPPTLPAVSAGGMADVALEVFARMRVRAPASRPRKSTRELAARRARLRSPGRSSAFEIYHAMADDGAIAPNKRTFVLLIDARAARAGKPELAFGAFPDRDEEIFLRLVLIIIFFFIFFILFFFRRGRRRRPRRVQQAHPRVRRRGPRRPARALELFEEVKHSPSLAPTSTRTAPSSGACAAAGDAAAADALVAEMSERGVRHNRVTRHARHHRAGEGGSVGRRFGSVCALRSVRGGSGDERGGPFRRALSTVFETFKGRRGSRSR